ncbi:hypothetical protein [Methylomagnum sp.]
MLGPASAVQLSQYLELLKRDRPTCDPEQRLIKQLLNGLRICDFEGHEAIYCNFELHPYSGDMPVIVKEGLPALCAEDIFNREALKKFAVRLEDVAGYLRDHHPLKQEFPWLDQNEEKLTLRVEDQTQEAFISYFRAEAILRKCFNESGLEITQGEIALWLNSGIIHAWTSPYIGAWPIEYDEWVEERRRKSPTGALSLQQRLVPLWFDQKELETVCPPIRWLSYDQLCKRWKSFFLSEEDILSVIENHHFENGPHILINYPNPLSFSEACKLCSFEDIASAREARNYFPGAYYRLCDIEEYEKKNLLPVLSDGAEVETITADETKQSPAQDHISTGSAEPATLEPSKANQDHEATSQAPATTADSSEGQAAQPSELSPQPHTNQKTSKEKRNKGRSKGDTTGLWKWADPYILARPDWTPDRFIREFKRLVLIKDPKYLLVSRGEQPKRKNRQGEMPDGKTRGFFWQGACGQLFVSDQRIRNHIGELRKPTEK